MRERAARKRVKWGESLSKAPVLIRPQESESARTVRPAVVEGKGKGITSECEDSSSNHDGIRTALPEVMPLDIASKLGQFIMRKHAGALGEESPSKVSRKERSSSTTTGLPPPLHYTPPANQSMVSSLDGRPPASRRSNKECQKPIRAPTPARADKAKEVTLKFRYTYARLKGTGAIIKKKIEELEAQDLEDAERQVRKLTSKKEALGRLLVARDEEIAKLKEEYEAKLAKLEQTQVAEKEEYGNLAIETFYKFWKRNLEGDYRYMKPKLLERLIAQGQEMEASKPSGEDISSQDHVGQPNNAVDQLTDVTGQPATPLDPPIEIPFEFAAQE
uniref:Uncharacterized protein n=1 Tax=Cannabis sativa TaxID=3483 RepID=A0A803Q391_CANSA